MEVSSCVAAACLLFVACDLLPPEAKPTEPSVAAAVTPITIPVILPTPAPTPKPTPTPGPAPAPTAAPPPTGGSCSLPPSNSPNAPCYPETQSFLTKVDRAITLVTEQEPHLFNFKDTRCDNCYYVKDPTRFAASVMQHLSAMGLCSTTDGEELAVKNQNGFNDQYDILIASNHIRRGAGSYRGTCRPSWF